MFPEEAAFRGYVGSINVTIRFSSISHTVKTLKTKAASYCLKCCETALRDRISQWAPAENSRCRTLSIHRTICVWTNNNFTGKQSEEFCYKTGTVGDSY